MEIDDLEWSWNELGKRDPLWAVLTDPRYANNQWDTTEFFQTGKDFLKRVVAALEALCPGLPRGRALDFGCGVGRLTQALTDHFDQAVGVDIAASMIEKAESFNRHGDRCIYKLNINADLSIFKSASFDFIMTFMVFQHMPPNLVLGYLKEFLRLLKPGAVAFFQVPIAEAGATAQSLSAKGDEPIMGMFPTSADMAQATIKASGGEILHAEEGDGAPGWVSYHVLMRKCL